VCYIGTLSIESLTLHPTRDPHVQIEKPRKRSNLLLRSQDWYTQRPDTKLHSRRSSLARTRCLAPPSLPPKKLQGPESEFASLLKTSFKVVRESRAGILRWYLAGPLPWSWACCSKLSQIKFCAISWSGFEEVKTKILDAENPHFDYSRNSWVSVSLMASQNSSSEFVAVYCGCRILFPSEDQTFGESLMGKCCLIQVSKTICWNFIFLLLVWADITRMAVQLSEKTLVVKGHDECFARAKELIEKFNLPGTSGTLSLSLSVFLLLPLWHLFQKPVALNREDPTPSPPISILWGSRYIRHAMKVKRKLHSPI